MGYKCSFSSGVFLFYDSYYLIMKSSHELFMILCSKIMVLINKIPMKFLWTISVYKRRHQFVFTEFYKQNASEIEMTLSTF